MALVVEAFDFELPGVGSDQQAGSLGIFGSVDLEASLGGEKVEERIRRRAEMPALFFKEQVPVDGEVFAVQDTVALRLGEDRLDVLEIDAFQRFLHMEIAGLARLGVDAVEVVNPVGGVGVLLDFEDEVARADGVDASGGEEHDLAG